MRWFFALVAVGVMCLGGCSGDESGTAEAWNFPKPASGAEEIELESTQRQSDFLLEPGCYKMGIYNDDDEASTCRTSDAVAASLVEVTSA